MFRVATISSMAVSAMAISSLNEPPEWYTEQQEAAAKKESWTDTFKSAAKVVGGLLPGSQKKLMVDMDPKSTAENEGIELDPDDFQDEKSTWQKLREVAGQYTCAAGCKAAKVTFQISTWVASKLTSIVFRFPQAAMTTFQKWNHEGMVCKVDGSSQECKAAQEETKSSLSHACDMFSADAKLIKKYMLRFDSLYNAQSKFAKCLFNVAGACEFQQSQPSQFRQFVEQTEIPSGPQLTEMAMSMKQMVPTPTEKQASMVNEINMPQGQISTETASQLATEIFPEFFELTNNPNAENHEERMHALVLKVVEMIGGEEAANMVRDSEEKMKEMMNLMKNSNGNVGDMMKAFQKAMGKDVPAEMKEMFEKMQKDGADMMDVLQATMQGEDVAAEMEDMIEKVNEQVNSPEFQQNMEKFAKDMQTNLMKEMKAMQENPEFKEQMENAKKQMEQFFGGEGFDMEKHLQKARKMHKDMAKKY